MASIDQSQVKEEETVGSEERFYREVKQYEFVQFGVPDINNILRGKIVRAKFVDAVARKGFEVGNALCVMGPNCEGPVSALSLVGYNMPNQDFRPCLDTLTPWPWVGSEGHRVGNVLCDAIAFDSTPDFASPRQLLKTQLDELWKRHGLVLKTAFEYEFFVFKQGSLEPLGGQEISCAGFTSFGQSYDLLRGLFDTLSAVGVEINCFHPEYAPGQWEMTTEPLEGLAGGDAAFYVKSAVKGYFLSRGYHATFMSKPLPGKTAPSGLHLNHSIWSRDGEGGLQNAMLDAGADDKLSKVARHWLAGILTHAPALTALSCPTTNCYHRLHSFLTPSAATWAVDDRNVMLRVRTIRDNVFVENRLPSGSCTPYIAMAAIVAAGIDGLNRELECPAAVSAPPDPSQPQAEPLPSSLKSALDALEKDTDLRTQLGEKFVQVFLAVKREIDVGRLETADPGTEEERFELERKMYMNSL